jgi:hypothetical protein
MRADRAEYIAALSRENINVTLFGSAGGNFVSYSEMFNIFSSSKINLNFSKTYEYMKLAIKARIFEVCLAGGFLLTEYFPGIEDYFQIDKEVVCFSNKKEMLDKIRYYLGHDQERQAIAQAGWEKANSKYSSFHILSEVFQKIAHSSEVLTKPKALRMPMHIRKRASQYYFNWAVAFSLANCGRLWQDALKLALSRNPANLQAWVYWIIGSCPPFVRSAILATYRYLRSKLSFML